MSDNVRTQVEKILYDLKNIEDNKLRKQYTLFNEKLVSQRNPQFILNPNVPISLQQRDDDSDCINGGSVTKVGAEYRVRATSQTNSKGVLKTKEKGNYISGNVSAGGIGSRPDSLPTGDAFMKWGPYDYNGGNRTGGYFHLDKDGLRVILEDQGTIIDQFSTSEWNLSDNVRIDILGGNVYQVVFGYYGYLPFVWQVSKESSFDPYSMDTLHWYKRKDSVSISNPNVPITAEVDSGTTGQQLDLFIGGRQFSTYGRDNSPSRHPTVTRSVSSISSTGWTPIIAVRKKSSLNQIICEFEKLSVVADVRGIWRIVVGDSPTGSTNGWVNPPGYDTGEVATEYVLDATTAGDSTSELTRDIFGGSNRAGIVDKQNLPSKPYFNGEVYSLEVQADSTNVDLLAALKSLEKW